MSRGVAWRCLVRIFASPPRNIPPRKIWVKKENNLLHTVGNNHIVGGLCCLNSKFQPQSQIMEKTKIAVAGTGYVGLSIATLLSQHHHVTAVDVVPEKVDKINNRRSPIQDEYIEK